MSLYLGNTKVAPIIKIESQTPVQPVSEMVTITVNNFYGITATPDTATVTQDEFYNWVVTTPKHSLFVITGGMVSTPAGINVTVGEVFTQSHPPAYYYYVQTGDVDGEVNAS
jgi:hypothetical protein